MRYRFGPEDCRALPQAIQREWLLTNGLGGYAMGTVSGINTRRYHGMLVAATSPPAHRTVLLNNIEVFVEDDAESIGLSANQYSGAIYPEGFRYLDEFTVDRVASWHFSVGQIRLVKRLYIHPGANACTIELENAGSRPIGLVVRPLVQHKFYHGNFRENSAYPQALTFPKNMTVVEDAGVTLALRHDGAQRVPALGWYYRFEYGREVDRGLDSRDDLFCPCELKYELMPGDKAVLCASTDLRTEPLALPPAEPDFDPTKFEEALLDAARHFLVQTPTRTTIMAGYPWFADWGRDTMICLPGICLATDNAPIARSMLLDYAGHIKDGLIPNRFVETGDAPEYNTADASLWFIEAAHQTLLADWDQGFAALMSEAVREIIELHRLGTRFGIGMDPSDYLLEQGEPGLQLTWMDAKVGDWVVTPRHGKPVEVNGLWIHGLRVFAWLLDRLGKDGHEYFALADQAEASFERKFWKESVGHYLDTCEPDDASLRPNQLIPLALTYGPVGGDHGRRAMEVVREHLLTPVGLRTLGPDEPGYHGRYRGMLPELDAAYHQGTVWPWLLGPYVMASLRLGFRCEELAPLVRGLASHLTEVGIGGLPEVYDGDEPRLAGGCPWQAWSVAQVLWCLRNLGTSSASN